MLGVEVEKGKLILSNNENSDHQALIQTISIQKVCVAHIWEAKTLLTNSADLRNPKNIQTLRCCSNIIDQQNASLDCEGLICSSTISLCKRVLFWVFFKLDDNQRNDGRQTLWKVAAPPLTVINLKEPTGGVFTLHSKVGTKNVTIKMDVAPLHRHSEQSLFPPRPTTIDSPQSRQRAMDTHNH